MIAHKNKKYYALITIILFLLGGCRNKEATKNGNAVIPVKIMKVELTNMERTFDYVGNIKAQEEVLVYPKVTGKISEKVREEDSPVEKSDVIAYIDRDEVGLKFEKAPVDSPIRGVVGRFLVDKGANVTPQTPIALVVSMDKVKIELYIPEQFLPQVTLKKRARIQVDAYPQEEFVGEVTKISPVLDLATRSAPIEITIDNQEHKLKSGMFARVSLIVEEHKNVPVVLKEAIMGREPQNYLYIVENGRAIMKQVVLGLHQGELYEIKDGLQQGQQVVILGQQRLYENAPVTVEEYSGLQSIDMPGGNVE